MRPASIDAANGESVPVKVTNVGVLPADHSRPEIGKSLWRRSGIVAGARS